MKYHVAFKFSHVFLIPKHKASVCYSLLLVVTTYLSIILLLSLYMSANNDQFWLPATGAASAFKMVLCIEFNR